MHKSRPDRTAQAPYGRACPPVASLPSPRRFASACRGRWPLKMAGLRPGDLPRRGGPRRYQIHRLRPRPALQRLKGRQKRFSRKDGLPRPCPTSNACADWKAARLNAKRTGGAARPSSWPASSFPDTDQKTTARTHRSAQAARNRERVGEWTTEPLKTLLRASQAEFPPRAFLAGLAQGREIIRACIRRRRII